MNIYGKLIIVGLVLSSSLSIQAQCSLPVLSDFSEPQTDGFKIEWIDFNSSFSSFEIEFGEKGFQRNFLPDIKDISDTQYTFSGLQSGKSYEIYIRTVCSPMDTSQWNGPYFYNTIIENGDACDLEFRIEDNNCPNGQEFLISVEEGIDSLLGVNIILEKVRLTIDHPWPPDLLVKLVSPYDSEITLSRHNGNGIDNYGDYSETDCLSAVFSDNACLSIKDYPPPFVGDFKPEDPLSSLFNGMEATGLWKLFVCDRAFSDLGVLRNIELVFSEEACVVPRFFNITDVESEFATLNWESSEQCENLKISYKVVGAPVSETFIDFVECVDGQFLVPDLEADTEYELTVVAQCDEDSNSPESCILYFKTSCKESSFLEDFDDDINCDPTCDSNCPINSIWKNAKSNSSDWIINRGQTLTSFTGPDGDKNIRGAYVYIENQLSRCSEELTINLVSDCLTKPESNDCAISFYYHMYGQDIGSLALEYAIDSTNWILLWEKQGDQGEQWHFEVLSLDDMIEYGRLRFRAVKLKDGLRGDIALDHIKLIGIDTITARTYFKDSDGDNFGDANEIIFACQNFPPLGYSDNSLDCDDLNAQINPGQMETPCNSVDENCNGDIDDFISDNIQIVILNQTDETCIGTADATVQIEASGGTPPYEYSWSHGGNGESIGDLSEGVYYVSVSDNSGCQVISDAIIINASNQINYRVIGILESSCQGINDGVVSIDVNGGAGSYDILWNHGDTGPLIENLGAGIFQATITDSLGCRLVTEEIELLASPEIVIGTAIVKDVDCYGDSNGLIQLGVAGGQPPYRIKWSTGDSLVILRDLAAGQYAVTVTDMQGCEAELNHIQVMEPDSLVLSINNIEDITCPDGFDSYIDLNIEGGNAPFSYFWSDGSFTEDIFSKKAGLYHVTVTDFNACSGTLENIEIKEPSGFQLQVDSIANVACKGSDDGFIEVSLTGASPPYSYNWNINDGDSLQSNYLENLLPGQYFLTVVDDFGCKSETFAFDILNNDREINLELDLVEGLPCFGDSTAVVSALSSGGILPLDYNWNNGQKRIKPSNVDTINNLISGWYQLTITDSEGCVGISDSLFVESPDEITFSVIEIINNKCFGDSLGSIEILPEGGTGQLNIEWDNGSVMTAISSLANGNYGFTISDENTCLFESNELSIGSPAQLEINVVSTNPSSQQMGSIEVFPFGGTSPYSYMWDDPLASEMDSLVNDLTPGTYQVTIVDSEGCSIDTLITLDFVDSTEEPLEDYLIVYPIPTRDLLNVNISNFELQRISLVSTNGKLIKEILIQNSPTSFFQIDMSDLETGMYFIKLEGTETSVTRKVLLVD